MQIAAISKCTKESVLQSISAHGLDTSLPVAIDIAPATMIADARSTCEQYHAPGERLPRATLCDGDGRILWRGYALDKKLEQEIVRIFETDPDMRGRNYKRLRALEKIQAFWRHKKSTSAKLLEQ